MGRRTKRTEDPRTYALRLRTKFARERSGASQPEIARALGIEKADTYAKYENRPGSSLPSEYLMPFCRATGVSLAWLLDPGPDLSPDPHQAPENAFYASRK